MVGVGGSTPLGRTNLLIYIYLFYYSLFYAHTKYLLSLDFYFFPTTYRYNMQQYII